MIDPSDTAQGSRQQVADAALALQNDVYECHLLFLPFDSAQAASDRTGAIDLHLPLKPSGVTFSDCLFVGQVGTRTRSVPIKAEFLPDEKREKHRQGH